MFACSALLSTADGTVLMPKFCFCCAMSYKKNEISHFSTIFRIVGGSLILLLNLVSDFLLYLKRLTRESLSKTHKRPEVRSICQNLSSVLHKTKSKVYEIADS